MARYFLELTYKGTAYSGFQSQLNANTIQNEVEKAFGILQKQKPAMTGSSRTDAGVHAIQNYFHFDYEGDIHPHFIYKMNAILPTDIAIRKLMAVAGDAHCRFDAISREYKYYIYGQKDPFLKERAYYFPYTLEFAKLEEAAALIMNYSDFSAFSKRKTQVRNFICQIHKSEWIREGDCLVYHIVANRFLRGMVRGLVATMLLLARGRITTQAFCEIIESKDTTRANFSAPGKGLFLVKVSYPQRLF